MPIDLSILNPKVLCYYIAGILPLSIGIGINFIFRGIVDYSKIKLVILLKGLIRIQI